MPTSDWLLAKNAAATGGGGVSLPISGGTVLSDFEDSTVQGWAVGAGTLEQQAPVVLSTTDTSWTVPANVQSATINVVGGSGGSGTGAGAGGQTWIKRGTTVLVSANGGGSGTSGSTTTSTISLTPNEVLTVSVGLGGTAGTGGSAGANGYINISDSPFTLNSAAVPTSGGSPNKYLQMTCGSYDPGSPNPIHNNSLSASKTYSGPYPACTVMLQYRANANSGLSAIKLNGVSMGALTKDATWRTIFCAYPGGTNPTITVEHAGSQHSTSPYGDGADIDSVTFSYKKFTGPGDGNTWTSVSNGWYTTWTPSAAINAAITCLGAGGGGGAGGDNDMVAGQYGGSGGYSGVAPSATPTSFVAEASGGAGGYGNYSGSEIPGSPGNKTVTAASLTAQSYQIFVGQGGGGGDSLYVGGHDGTSYTKGSDIGTVTVGGGAAGGLNSGSYSTTGLAGPGAPGSVTITW